MTKKIKLAEAARDLKIENQEIIDLMEKYDGTKRKNTTSLSAEELNYILEHYSQNNQVKDFNAYFESKNKPIEEKPAEEVKKPAVKKEKQQRKPNLITRHQRLRKKSNRLKVRRKQFQFLRLKNWQRKKSLKNLMLKRKLINSKDRKSRFRIKSKPNSSRNLRNTAKNKKSVLLCQ